eukprot:5338108-Pyramimonas_sp.AAC.1
MSHYVRCPVLWGLVCHPAEPPVRLSARLGLAGAATPEEVERIARAHHMYNVARTVPDPGPLDSEEDRARHFYAIRRAT